MLNLNKVASVIDLFRKGQSVANPEKWKNRQVTTTVVATVIVAGANTATVFGYPVPVDMDTANTLAVGLISIFNAIMTYVTTDKIGLPEKQEGLKIEVNPTDEKNIITQIAETTKNVKPTEKTKDEQVIEYCTKNFLIPFEGTGPIDSDGNFCAYIDPVGIPTIAWGITFDEKGVKVKIGEKWSYDRAYNHKQNILKKFLSDLYKSSPILVSQPIRRIAAVLSWVYNLGIVNYNASTFKKKIDLKEWNNAAQECKKWNKGRVKGKLVELKGLTRRRETEAACILNK